VVRRDPMAMLPFIGYNVNDYLEHWLDTGARVGEENMPRIYYVNWFRRTPEGGFAWPGFGENSRVVKWIVERLKGTAEGHETPVGVVPGKEDLDLTGLDISDADLEAALRVDKDEWLKELPGIDEWFARLGDVPEVILEQRAGLEDRLRNS